MTEEKDKSLCEKYPKIFRDRNRSMQETCMCWGFECGDGWYDIIDALCGTIQHHLNWKRGSDKHKGMTDEEWDESHQVVAAQVKEKFGGLRFYIRGGDDFVEGAIALAESLSFRTCEECGAPGSRRGGGWIRTLCDSHAVR